MPPAPISRTHRTFHFAVRLGEWSESEKVMQMPDWLALDKGLI
jgi:hypothetical protein